MARVVEERKGPGCHAADPVRAERRRRAGLRVPRKMFGRVVQLRSRFGHFLLSARKTRENRPPQKARRTDRPCHECLAHTRLPYPRGFAEMCRNMQVRKRLKI